jgi:hypothetical protein
MLDINFSLSDHFLFYQEIPQASVLGSFSFILYTTPLGSHISDSSVSHQLYADDAHICISFAAYDFSADVLNLQGSIALISNWMALNHLCFNESITEFPYAISCPYVTIPLAN